MNICSHSLMRAFFRDFTYDPDTFEQESDCREYLYSSDASDAFFQRQERPDRLHFAVMSNNEVIGDLYFKNICKESSCTLSIHLKNDSVKNRGYGTQAEHLALQYAFQKMKLKKVYADALIKNTRSIHVLQKVGFFEISRNETLCRYVCTQDSWVHQRTQANERRYCP